MKNWTPLIDAYLLEEQFCQISVGSDLKRRSLRLFKERPPTRTSRTRWVAIWNRYGISSWCKRPAAMNIKIGMHSLGFIDTVTVMLNTHPRRDETVLSRRVGVGGVYMNSQLAHDDCRRIRSTIWKLANCVCFCLTTWILIDTDNFFNSDDKWRHC